MSSLDLCKCLACNGTGVARETDDQGNLNPPAPPTRGTQQLETICGWCAGSGHTTHRRAADFTTAWERLNAECLLLEPKD